MVVTDYVHVYSLRVKRKPECTMHHWQLKKTNKHLLSITALYSITHIIGYPIQLIYVCTCCCTTVTYMISRTGTCSTYVSKKLNLFQPLPAQ